MSEPPPAKKTKTTETKDDPMDQSEPQTNPSPTNQAPTQPANQSQPQPAVNSGITVTHTLESAEDTERFGWLLSRLARPGDVVTLSGELGAGKTCIARGFIRDFFRNPLLDVPSPSYLLSLSYADDKAYIAQEDVIKNSRNMPSTVDARAGEARIPGATVYHVDPFRLTGKSQGKLAALVNWQEVFEKEIALIEWPSKMGANILAPTTPPRLQIAIEGIGPQAQGRIVTLSAIGDRWETVLQEWKANGIPTVECDVAGVDGVSMGVPTLSTTEPQKPKPGNTCKTLPENKDEWLVLGIETSCDDTGAAVVRGDGKILGEALASQAHLHCEWGGVKPDVAQGAHREAINSTVETALQKAGIAASDLHGVAVTVGPGLSLCLDIGVRKALQIAAEHRLPLVRVHHMEAHAMITRLPTEAKCGMQFPALLMLVSGGHNMLVLTEGIGKHRIIGSTLDDSIGEAFDKTARLLGIEAIPGGPHLEKLAMEGDKNGFSLPVPLSKSTTEKALRESCDFSFAGLKTNVRTLVATEKDKLTKIVDETERETRQKKVFADIAASFQSTAITHLMQRTQRALTWAKEDNIGLKCVVVAGGVAANKTLRAELDTLASKHDLPLICPPIRLCMDNGIMVAWAGVERLGLGLYEVPPTPEMVEMHVEVRPRWPIGPRDPRSRPKPTGKKK
eukprot:TRINITY_DN94685_c0_g1_i1.p1 TRINITY_DN94685_c0_g1~~TRINITY_DN94685_c0_g1_i1.p1  ORF type:complete len:677 (+),score=61.50 TRINITY_DN94685_c0_g1_i1:99-2129(+)